MCKWNSRDWYFSFLICGARNYFALAILCIRAARYAHVAAQMGSRCPLQRAARAGAPRPRRPRVPSHLLLTKPALERFVLPPPCLQLGCANDGNRTCAGRCAETLLQQSGHHMHCPEAIYYGPLHAFGVNHGTLDRQPTRPSALVQQKCCVACCS